MSLGRKKREQWRELEKKRWGDEKEEREGSGDGKAGRTGDEWERESGYVEILGFGPIKIAVVMLTQPSLLSLCLTHTLRVSLSPSDSDSVSSNAIKL